MGRKQAMARFKHHLPPSAHRPAVYRRTPKDKQARPQGAPTRPPKPASWLCKFCFEEDAVWAAKPCFHKILCEACLLLEYFLRCPVCGRPINAYYGAGFGGHNPADP